MVRTAVFPASALLALAGTASAEPILNFGQVTGGDPVTATQTGSATDIATTNTLGSGARTQD